MKKSGKRLKLAQVPVPADDQAFGMDRTLAVGNAIAQLTGTEVRLPEGWQLVEIDTRTLGAGGEGGRGREEAAPPPLTRLYCFGPV